MIIDKFGLKGNLILLPCIIKNNFFIYSVAHSKIVVLISIHFVQYTLQDHLDDIFYFANSNY